MSSAMTFRPLNVSWLIEFALPTGPEAVPDAKAKSVIPGASS